MLLVPGRVVDFGNDGLDVLVSGIKAVVEADRIHFKAQVAKMRQQPDRTLGSPAESRCHQIAHCFVQRLIRWPEVVGSSKPGDRRPSGGPQATASKQRA